MKMNTFEVEGLNSQKYHNYELLAKAITDALTGNESEISAGRGYGAFNDFGLCSTVTVGEAMGRAFAEKVADNTEKRNETAAEPGSIPPDFDPVAEMEKGKAKALEQMQTTGIPAEAEGTKKCPGCGNVCRSRFCPECGTQTVDPIEIICADCGCKVEMKGKIPKFCPECGHKFSTDDMHFN